MPVPFDILLPRTKKTEITEGILREKKVLDNGLQNLSTYSLMSCQKKLGNPIWVCYSLASELEMTQYSLFMDTNPTLVPFEANLLYRVRRSNANFAFIL